VYVAKQVRQARRSPWQLAHGKALKLFSPRRAIVHFGVSFPNGD